MKTVETPLPWTEAVRDRDSDARARFIESHLDLVKYLALRISARLPAGIDIDDLLHDGILGLLDAVDKFSPSKRVLFRTYAESRIRGSILDGLRQKDWLPRSVRSLRRKLQTALAELSQGTQRSPSEEELAAALNLEPAAFQSAMCDLNIGPLLSLDELTDASGLTPATADSPAAPLERSDLLQALSEEITRLPERERRVLELYYHEELNMKEVGAVLGVTESRVCQLHAQAASRLRTSLGDRLHAQPVVAAALAGRR